MDCHSPSYGHRAGSAGAQEQLRMDGREVPVLRANQLCHAVRVEPGWHVILFYFRQHGLLAGLFISVLTLIVLLGGYLRNPDFDTEESA